MTSPRIASGSAASSPPLEIERSFLLRGMPVLPRMPCMPPQAIERLWFTQGYLPLRGDGVVRPAAAGDAAQAATPILEGRLRRIERADGTVEHRHTVKTGVGLVRTEVERAIDSAEFDAAWPATAGRRLSKTRFRVREGEFTWEIDRFDGFDLVLAEVELPDPAAVALPPAWLAPWIVREVTDEPAYRNFELACGRGG